MPSVFRCMIVILTYFSVFFLLSICDMGNPSNISVHGGITFNYGKAKKPASSREPQVYHDVEAQGPAAGSSGIENQSGKTSADVPTII